MRCNRDAFAVFESEKVRMAIYLSVYFMGMVEHGRIAVISDEEKQQSGIKKTDDMCVVLLHLRLQKYIIMVKHQNEEKSSSVW